MRIALGCDHGGFPLKGRIRAEIEARGLTVVDCGTDSDCSVDYPDYALKVAKAILAGEADRGMLLCGSGVGISVAANKIPGIRAGRPTQDYLARVVTRITVAGALFLGTVAALPPAIGLLQPEFQNIALGGTSILIVVSVVVETMKQLEAQLLIRQYEGFIR